MRLIQEAKCAKPKSKTEPCAKGLQTCKNSENSQQSWNMNELYLYPELTMNPFQPYSTSILNRPSKQRSSERIKHEFRDRGNHSHTVWVGYCCLQYSVRKRRVSVSLFLHRWKQNKMFYCVSTDTAQGNYLWLFGFLFYLGVGSEFSFSTSLWILPLISLFVLKSLRN